MAPALSAKEPSAGFSELALVEPPLLELPAELGWQRSDLLNEVPGPQSLTGRSWSRETVLTDPVT